MRHEEPTVKVSYSCDGCDYLMSEPHHERPAIEVRVPWDGHDITRDTDNVLVFHFHAPMGNDERHDCFRYWAHNPHTMRRSLKNRGFTEDQIDDFMAVMLYRDSERIGSVGVSRPQ